MRLFENKCIAKEGATHCEVCDLLAVRSPTACSDYEQQHGKSNDSNLLQGLEKRPSLLGAAMLF